MRIQAAFIQHDVRFAFDVGDEQLGPFREGWRDAVNRAIPGAIRPLRTVTLREHFPVALHIGGKPRITAKVGQPAVILERIHHAQPAPLHRACQNIARRRQRQLAFVLHIQCFQRADEYLIRTRGDSDAHRAAGFFQRWKPGLQAAHQGKGGKAIRLQQPRIGAWRQARQFPCRAIQMARGAVQPGAQPRERRGADLRAVRHPHRTMCPPLDNRDGRVSSDFALKRLRAHHVHTEAQRIAAGNHLAQRTTIAVLHPAVRANERQHAVRCQQPQRLLHERHIEVGTVIQRMKTPAILREQRCRDHLLTHIRRIARHKIKARRKRLEQKIRVHQPRLRQRRRIVPRKPVLMQERQQFVPGFCKSLPVQLHTAHSLEQPPCGNFIPPRRLQQPLHGRQQKIPRTAGWLQQPHPAQRLVLRVARQVEHEFHHLPARIDRPALLTPHRFHTLHLLPEKNLGREKFGAMSGVGQHVSGVDLRIILHQATHHANELLGRCRSGARLSQVPCPRCPLAALLSPTHCRHLRRGCHLEFRS